MIFKRFLQITLAAFVLLSSQQAFAQIQVQADLTQKNITIDGETTIVLTVSGSKSFGDPVVPRVAGLDIVQTGRSSQFSIINGKMSSMTRYEFTVIPSEVGAFTIPSFEVFSSGVSYKSRSLILKVQKTSRVQSHQNQQLNPQTGSSTKTGVYDPFWMTASVSKTNPKIYEQVIFRFKLYARTHVDFTDFKLPEFKDFRVEQLVPERKGQEIISGQRHFTYEIIYALFPLKTGKITIEDTKVQVQYYVQQRPKRSRVYDPFANDPFFNRAFQKPQSKTLRAKPIELNVTDLPQPVPENYTNLIGRFGLQTELDNDQVQAGEPILLKISFSGEGNVTQAKLPEISLPDFKVYKEKPKNDLIKSENGLSGQKTFQWTLIPQKAGTLKIPQTPLYYYDTATNSYSELLLPEYEIKVTPNANEQFVKTGTSDQKPLETDEKIQSVDGKLTPIQNKSELLKKLFFISDKLMKVAISIIFILFVLIVLICLKRRFAFLSGGKAYQKALKNIKRLKPSLSEKEIFARIQEYFTALSSQEITAWTSADVTKFCEKQGVDTNLCQSLNVYLQRLEASEYAFDHKPFTKEEKQELFKVLNQIHKHMEKNEIVL